MKNCKNIMALRRTLIAVLKSRSSSLLIQTENTRVHLRVRRARCEIVERLRRRSNHMRADERRAFARAVLGMLQAAFPLEHGPAVVTVLRKLREDAREVDLAVAR